MKTKITIGLFALAIAYGCTAKKAVAPTQDVKEVAETPVAAIAPTVGPAFKTFASAETLAEGKSLYGMNCAKCHELFDKTSYTAEQWRPIVLEMQKKARISDEHREKIYAYLITP